MSVPVSDFAPCSHRDAPSSERHRTVTTRRALGVLAALGAALFHAPDAGAQYGSVPKLVLHARSAGLAAPCSGGPGRYCEEVRTEAGLSRPGVGPYHYVYLLAYRGPAENLAGIECSIDYQGTASGAATDGQGLDIFEWTSCATAEFRADGWPAAGSSNIIVWDTVNRCQTVIPAVAGYFYVGAYNADALKLTPHVYSRKASIADCASAVTSITTAHLGIVEFGGGPGCSPCFETCPDRPIPVPPPPPTPGPVDPTSGTARLFLHVAPRTPQENCVSARLTDPMKAVTAADLTPSGGPFYNVFLLADRGALPSLAGLECRIDFQSGTPGGRLDQLGIDIFAWTLCADAEVRGDNWPDALGANQIIWNPVNNCRVEPVSVAGYFYMAAYSADDLRILGRNGTASAELVDCAGETLGVPAENMGVASFSPGAAKAGCNPFLRNCVSSTPVVAATWSRVKSFLETRSTK